MTTALYHAYVGAKAGGGTTCGKEYPFMGTPAETFCESGNPCTNYSKRECTR